jgi:heptosyltransferase-2
LEFDKRGQYGGLGGILKFARKLKGMNFDMVISPHKSFRTALTLYLSRIPVRIGFRQSAAAFLYTGRVGRNMALHEVERNLGLLAPICSGYSMDAAKSLGGTPKTYLDKDYADISSTFMRVSAENRPVVGINAGSVWATKRWPVERYADLATLLHKDGYAIALFGGPGDKEVNDKLKSLLDFEYFDYANTVAFSQIPALIHNLAVLITNDSAPLHIAVSQNTPAVAIFGATVPELGFYPYSGNNIVMQNEGLPCRPCGLHGGNTCPEEHFRCMLEITPEDVHLAVKRLVL